VFPSSRIVQELDRARGQRAAPVGKGRRFGLNLRLAEVLSLDESNLEVRGLGRGTYISQHFDSTLQTCCVLNLTKRAEQAQSSWTATNAHDIIDFWACPYGCSGGCCARPERSRGQEYSRTPRGYSGDFTWCSGEPQQHAGRNVMDE
jgi:hypothetical protein